MIVVLFVDDFLKQCWSSWHFDIGQQRAKNIQPEIWHGLAAGNVGTPDKWADMSADRK